MSVAYTEHPEEGYIEVLIDGGVSSEEMAEIMPRIETFAAAAEDVSILKTIRRMGFVNPLAALPYSLTGLRMLPRVRRVAIVTDLTALGPLTRMSGIFTPIETRQFRLSEDAAARAWLTRTQAEQSPA
jgi:Protein of unknown function (DUF3478).